MSTETTFIDLLEGYLDDFDGPTPMPDHVRDAIHAALPQTAQARPVPVIGRVFDMSGSSTALRWAIAAALVVTAIVVGGALMSTGGGGLAPATASPTASRSSSPAAVALSSAPPAACRDNDITKNCIPAGTYTLPSASWPRKIGLTVPTGWFNWNPGADYDGVLVDGGPEAPGSGWGLMFMTVGEVAKDPCDGSKGTTTLASPQTADALIAAMRAWPGFAVSDPAPVVIDGQEGKIVELTSAVKPADCSGLGFWRSQLGTPIDRYPLATTDVASDFTVQFRIFEFDGRLVVIRTTDFPQTSPNEIQQGVAMDPARHADDQVALQRIIDSITFTP